MKPTLALLLTSLIWGVTFVAVKSALGSVSPLFFVALRFTIGAVTALVLVRPSAGLRASLLAGIPLGLLLAAAYAAQTIGLVSTTPSRSAFLTALSIGLVPFCAAALGQGRVRLAGYLALALIVPGLWCVTRPAGTSLGLSGWNVGDSWTVVCAVLFAWHIVLLSRFAAKQDAGGLVFSQLATTAVLAYPVAIVSEDIALEWTPEVIAALVVTGIFASTVTTWLQTWAQPKVGSSRAALIFATEPVFAALFSALVLGERFGWMGLLGAALILGGVVLSETRGSKEQQRIPASPVA